MELASMLAGEPFSGHPRSVCPVIGAFLRADNDRLDDCWRQDLYEYAANEVGTRITIEVERQRAQVCRAWMRRMKGPGVLSQEPLSRSEVPGRRRRSLRSYCHRPEHAGHHAALAFGSELGYGGRTLDHELIAVHGREELDRPTERGATPDVESLREAL